MRLVLDSTFLIDHLRGDPAAVSRWAAIFEHGDEPLVNEIVVCEVRSGLHPVDAVAFDRLLEPIEFVQPGRQAASRAGAWRWEARGRGHSLSLANTLVAAAADAAKAAVLTRNVQHFALLPVRVETY
jgi:predicted nucleic acid-binding protein